MKEILILLCVVLVGCGEIPVEIKDKREVVIGEGIDSTLQVYSVRGVDVECLWKGRGMSCNWAKHNELQKEKLTK